MRNFCVLLLSFFIATSIVEGQFYYKEVFPDLSGNALNEAVVSTFKSNVSLSFSQSRDTLMAKIYAVNDTVEAIYCGYKQYIDPNLDPTISVFGDGLKDGINTEHCYPQSRGAENDPARSDMHHLFPSKINVNGDRSSKPFAEIPDNSTQKWYLNTIISSSIPTTNKDAYAEGTSENFEPRESVKGNVARAIFYFYTMYRDEALAADASFFEGQRETLIQWHYLDPVDSLEWDRTYKIANYQGGKVNPFVLDCTLAARMYGNEIPQACQLISSTESEDIEVDNNISIYPNPARNSFMISTNFQEEAELNVSLLDIMGRKISTESFQLPAGIFRVTKSLDDDMNEGLYWVKFDVIKGQKIWQQVKPLIISQY